MVLAGCGDDGPRRYDVSGTVAYNGQPLPAGQIFFDPDAAKGHDGPQGYALIKDGRYNTAETDQGPIGGPHIVRIEGYDGKPGEELPLGRPLFNDFQQSVDLPQEDTKLDFVVRPGLAN
jgi:hypothetical protein